MAMVIWLKEIYFDPIHPYSIYFDWYTVQAPSIMRMKYEGADIVDEILDTLISPEQKLSLKEAMNNLYGYGPYDNEARKKTLEDKFYSFENYQRFEV